MKKTVVISSDSSSARGWPVCTPWWWLAAYLLVLVLYVVLVLVLLDHGVAAWIAVSAPGVLSAVVLRALHSVATLSNVAARATVGSTRPVVG